MSSVLSQEEIDKLLKNMSGGKAPKIEKQKTSEDKNQCGVSQDELDALLSG